MADILKITTPNIDRTSVQANRPVADPAIPFQLSDVTKVVKPGEQSEILQQNNGMVDYESSATILMNLLKDPSVTVSFLKNIDMLQEIIKLLPVNNQTFTTEIEQLFNSLLITPDAIVEELINQEASSTSFKGELFEFLRMQVSQNSKPEMRYGICNLLKSLNAVETRETILKSISNSLYFLSENLSSSTSVSQKLYDLATRFLDERAANKFSSLKDETLLLLNEVKGNILYTPKLQKIVPMIIYNLSRFNDNPDYIKECVGSLTTLIDGDEQKQKLIELLCEYSENKDISKENSKVMDAITGIISKGSNNSEFTLLGGEKIEKIIYSLLSSPCNYTPLLHYIIPVHDDDLKSFAEIWIDPNAESSDSNGNTVCDCIHMLMVFDIEGIGRFEAEIAVANKDIMVNLFCPPSYLSAFSDLSSSVREHISSTGYRLFDLSVDKLDRHRSLMDVFKTLPHKRTGVDVKV